MNVRRSVYGAAVLVVMLPLIIVYETSQLAHRCADFFDRVQEFIDRAQGARWSEAICRAGEATERGLVATFGDWRKQPDEHL